VTALPPEIRDAVAGGKIDHLPARHRDLVRRYLLWLASQRPPAR
jgi:hypothetical protein